MKHFNLRLAVINVRLLPAFILIIINIFIYFITTLSVAVTGKTVLVKVTFCCDAIAVFNHMFDDSFIPFSYLDSDDRF